MALPASENFSGTWPDANWTVAHGTFDNTANQGHPNENAESGAWWNVDSFDGDHYAEQTTVSIDNGTWIGPATRMTTDQFYMLSSNDTASELARSDGAGGFTSIAGGGAPHAADDVMRLESIGDQHDPQNGGVTIVGIGIQTDAEYSGGAAGVYGFGFADSRFDDWTGDDLAGAASQNVTGTLAIANGAQTLAGTAAPGAITISAGLAVANGAQTLDGVALPGSVTHEGTLAIANGLALAGTPLSIQLPDATLAIANGITSLAGTANPGSVTHAGTLAIANGAQTLDGTPLSIQFPDGTLAIANGLALDADVTTSTSVTGTLAVATSVSLSGTPVPGSVTVSSTLSIANGVALDGGAIPGSVTHLGTLAIANGLGLDGQGSQAAPQNVIGTLAVANGLALDGVVIVDVVIALQEGREDKVTNGDFANWTGVFPTDTPDDWTVNIGGGQTADNYVTDAANAVQMVSDGTFIQLQQDIGAVDGHVYTIHITVKEASAGAIAIENDSGADLFTINSVGTFSHTYTADGPNILIKRSGVTDITFSDFLVRDGVTGRALALDGTALPGPITISGTLAIANGALSLAGQGNLQSFIVDVTLSIFAETGMDMAVFEETFGSIAVVDETPVSIGIEVSMT